MFICSSPHRAAVRRAAGGVRRGAAVVERLRAAPAARAPPARPHPHRRHTLAGYFLPFIFLPHFYVHRLLFFIYFVLDGLRKIQIYTSFGGGQ